MNLLRMLIVCFLLLSILQEVQCQTFNERIIFQEEIPAMDFSNILVKGDTIITIGRGAVLIPPYYPGKLMISKFDLSGEVFSWFNEYGPDTPMEFIPYAGRSIYQKENKTLVVGGAGDYFADDFGFAAMIDQHSSVDWIKIYPPSENSYAYRFISGIILANNDLLFLANRQESGYPAGYPISSVLIYSDNEGNVLWEREYESSLAYYIPGCFTIETDSTYLIGLRITNQDGSHSTILKTNQDGDILFEWNNDTPKTLEPQKILKTPDGGFVFVSKYFKETSEAGYARYQGYICKLDSTLNKEWDMILGQQSSLTRFNSLIQTYDGKFIALGAVWDTFQTDDVWRQKGWLVKFDQNGVIDWERKIISTSNRYSELSDAAETEDHGIVACGLSQSFSSYEDYPQRGWLLKLDEWGCLDPAFCDSTTTILIPPEENIGLSISPNPVSSFFTVRLYKTAFENGASSGIKHVQVYDLAGRVVFEKEFPPQSSVSLTADNWQPGIYVVVVNDRWVGKVVRQ
ncbi:MAG: T9SS type A sorting domain-containing protein [Lewinellaceae bacterium]|nr:T9SS type A sorting domain-containing protein [Lewinellaceae bacterium]